MLGVKAMRGLVNLPVRLAHVQIFATVRITFLIRETLPIVYGMDISMMTKPQVKFQLDLIGGDIMAFPGVEVAVRKQPRERNPPSLRFPVCDFFGCVSCHQQRKYGFYSYT